MGSIAADPAKWIFKSAFCCSKGLFSKCFKKGKIPFLSTKLATIKAFMIKGLELSEIEVLEALSLRFILELTLIAGGITILFWANPCSIK